MKITIEMAPNGHNCLQLLAFENGNGLDVEEYLQNLIFRETSKHPNWRQCASARCLTLVDPTISFRQAKHHRSELHRTEVSAVPATCCPECGGPVVTIPELIEMEKVREATA